MTEWTLGQWVAFLSRVLLALQLVVSFHLGASLFVVWLGTVIGIWEVPAWMT